MKTKTLLKLNALLAFLLYAIITYAKNFPLQVDLFYSNKLYPLLYKLRAPFFNLLPFSFGDIAYGFTFLFLLYLLKKIKWNNWPTALLKLLTSGLILILWFQLSWGLNYYRSPLLSETKNYTEDELIRMNRFFAEKSNQLHVQLSQYDSLAVELQGSKKEIIERVKNTADSDQIGKAKISLFSLPLSYMGFSGYLNPFTLEAQVNGAIPKINLPLTAAHEMAHQRGYAAENEANFIGFLECYKHPDPDMQYAAVLFGFRYTYSELYKANPTVAKEILCSLYPGILANFEASSAFWRKHKNPFEPLFKQSYDRYLKANNQRQGIQSYNAVVSLLIAHFKENDNGASFEK